MPNLALDCFFFFFSLFLYKVPLFSVYSNLEIIHRCRLFDNQIESQKRSPTSIRCKSRRSSLQHLCVDSHASPSLFSATLISDK
ncbi:hypothetical protein ACSBR1_004239 [Camellia fascicularis]